MATKTVRGNKVGTFQRKAFYLLDGGKCRHGSTGKIQDLNEFVESTDGEDRVKLLTMLPAEVQADYETPAEPTTKPTLFTGPTTTPLLEYHPAVVFEDDPLSDKTFNMLTTQSDEVVGSYFATLPKGIVRKIRKRLFAAGHRHLAAVKREKRVSVQNRAA